MDIDDLNMFWDMNPDLKEGGLIECPECNEIFDHINGPEFKIYNPPYDTQA